MQHHRVVETNLASLTEAGGVANQTELPKAPNPKHNKAFLALVSVDLLPRMSLCYGWIVLGTFICQFVCYPTPYLFETTK